MRQLRTLLQNPKWIKRVIDVDGDKAGILHILALNFNALYVREVVSILAKAGIDIDRKSGQTGELPLHLATLYGNVEMVKGLLDNGARIDLSDIRGFTPLKAAREMCKPHEEQDFKIQMFSIVREAQSIGNTSQDVEKEPTCNQVLKLLQEAHQKSHGNLSNASLQTQDEKLRSRGQHSPLIFLRTIEHFLVVLFVPLKSGKRFFGKRGGQTNIRICVESGAWMPNLMLREPSNSNQHSSRRIAVMLLERS